MNKDSSLFISDQDSGYYSIVFDYNYFSGHEVPLLAVGFTFIIDDAEHLFNALPAFSTFSGIFISNSRSFLIGLVLLNYLLAHF